MSNPSMMDVIKDEFIISTASAIAVKVGTSGWNKLKEALAYITGNKKDDVLDILDTSSGQEAARIALGIIKKYNGLPDKEVFDALKLYLKRYWDLSESESNGEGKALDFAEKISELDRKELQVLVAAYVVTKKEGFEMTEYVDAWTKQMEIETGMNFPELVTEARLGLTEKGLVLRTKGSDNNRFERGPGSLERNNLTGLGYSIVDFVYEDIKEAFE